MTSHQTQPIKIAVVGDVHELWEAEDAIALHQLGVDLVLFVGDFGNESVEVVRRIASLDLPKAVIMGNHDAWYTASDWGRKKCPYDRTQENRVQKQLELLGEAHIGYGYRDFPELQLSVVGSRPFSWGGMSWKNEEFYQDWYGVNSFEESVERIVTSAKAAAYETIIFMGHNGPTGLGDEPEAPCGKDWQPLGGDHGDPDFEDAIAQTLGFGKTIPLVTFGHMHHKLRHTKERSRTMIATSPEGIVYLNSASVPRIFNTETDRWRNFAIVDLEEGVVSEISLVWVGRDYTVVSQQLLYQRPDGVEMELAGRESSLAP
ncbi:MAG TPA: TIGR04168 family protein [Cyanobacteria bacterium UBA11370]|nr:TIGR04168 family protein [Cyanobacteria bacterium UBA11370]HBY79973.1 TIGR04168 family protein [Cyanobacteria bacterium UBA11148]